MRSPLALPLTCLLCLGSLLGRAQANPDPGAAPSSQGEGVVGVDSSSLVGVDSGSVAAPPSVLSARDAGAEIEVSEPALLQRVTLMWENDKAGGTDRFYTQGSKIAYQRNDPGWFSYLLNDLFSLLPFWKATPLAWGVVAGQNIYTPEDTEERRLLPNDRPYGAWLYLGFSLTRGNSPTDPERVGGPILFEERIVLDLGLIGHSALGRQVQNNVHEAINVATAKGWRNQLKSEFGFQLYYQRKWLVQLQREPGEGLGVDFLPHFGGALGNVFTNLSLGATLRVGWNLGQDDFGPAQRIASAGLDSLREPRSVPRVYAFARVEGRGVLWNAYIDGNLFRSPVRRLSVNGVVERHHVEREHFIADFEVGVVFNWHGVDCGFTLVTRTREFEAQRNSAVFGALHFALTF